MSDPIDLEAEWLYSLPVLDDTDTDTDSRYFVLALEQVALALGASAPETIIEHSQLTAAIIVAWSEDLPMPSSSQMLPDWDSIPDHHLLRYVAYRLLDADAARDPARAAEHLVNARTALFTLYRRHRDTPDSGAPPDRQQLLR